MADTAEGSGWQSSWPDALAFVGGLALAWFSHWQTKDLVWSLWLSSLVVGYAMIVWGIFGPVVLLVRGTAGTDVPLAARAGLDGVFIVGGLFMLAFFTVHFGMFHFVHSIFLNGFFPAAPGLRAPSAALYWQVAQAYWPFVLVAAVAERQAFRLAPRAPAALPDTAVTAEAIAARKALNVFGRSSQGGMMAPYKNVIRLHLLIFFFAFAHFAKLDSFLVYAVVYAVYFFPWRLVRKSPAATA